MSEEKIQDHFGADEIRNIVEKTLIGRDLEPRQDENYRELIHSRYLLSYRGEDGIEIYVYFNYDRDNVVEYYFEEAPLIESDSWDRDLLLVSFFGVDE